MDKIDENCSKQKANSIKLHFPVSYSWTNHSVHNWKIVDMSRLIKSTRFYKKSNEVSFIKNLLILQKTYLAERDLYQSS